jgi:hypothetical protein
VSSYAEVEVIVKVSNLGPWGDDCTLGQARKQAVESAESQIEQLFRGRACLHVVDTKVIAVSIGGEATE